MILRIASPAEINKVIPLISDLAGKGIRLFLLSGDLGAGKTTLVKALCEAWGVTEPVSSPTFSLVNEYVSPVHGVIYHMDLYRLEKPEDLGHIGFAEYLDSDHICLIEWPEPGRPYYAEPYVEIKIQVENNDLRIFGITTHDTMDT